MVGSCKTAVGSGLASLLLAFWQQLEWFLLTKNCNGKQPQTYMFSSLAAISDMSFVIFARANVF